MCTPVLYRVLNFRKLDADMNLHFFGKKKSFLCNFLMEILSYCILLQIQMLMS